MKRIAASLFVIVAILSVGVFATGAYFTTSVSGLNYNFQTQSAGLKFALCADGDTLNIDCIGYAATETSIDFNAYPQTIGPGLAHYGCMVVENTGAYALNLTAALTVTAQSHADMDDAFQVYAAVTDRYCGFSGVTSTPFGLQTAASAQAAGTVSIGSLAPGARMYIIQGNAWDSSWNQNYLQNGYIFMNTVLTGQTV